MMEKSQSLEMRSAFQSASPPDVEELPQDPQSMDDAREDDKLGFTIGEPLTQTVSNALSTKSAFPRIVSRVRTSDDTDPGPEPDGGSERGRLPA